MARLDHLCLARAILVSQGHEDHEGSKARRLVSLASQARKEFPLLYNDGRSLLFELRAQLSYSINT